MKTWNLLITCKSDLCTATGNSNPGLINCKTALERGIPYIPARRIKGCLLNAAKEMEENGVLTHQDVQKVFGTSGKRRNGLLRMENAYIRYIPKEILPVEERDNDTIVEECFSSDKDGKDLSKEERLSGREGNATLSERTFMMGQNGNVHLSEDKVCSDKEKNGILLENYMEFYEQWIHFGGTLPSVAEQVFTRIRTMTAFDLQQGTAADNSLRSLQVVPAGIIFAAKIFWETNDSEEICKKVLEKCVKGLRHIGMGITRGMGEVACHLEEVDSSQEMGLLPNDTPICNMIYKLEQMPAQEEADEIEMRYEIKLLNPVLLAGGKELQEGGPDQIPGSVVQGALAAFYIQEKHLGDNAHEDDHFRRIFLRDGVSFGYCFLKKGEHIYLPCPEAIVQLKYQKLWINRLLEYDQRQAQSKQHPQTGTTEDNYREKQPERFKGIHSQIYLDGEALAMANVQKEIRMHHSRPRDRAIAHAQNDRAGGLPQENGMLFQYLAFSKDQTFSGVWKGSPQDLCELLRCLKRSNGKLWLGRSKSAEYGKCQFIPVEIIHKEEKEGKHWLLWFLTPAVTTVDDIVIELNKKLNCNVSEGEGHKIIKYTTVGGYHTKWGLPLTRLQAIAQGSVMEIVTDQRVNASMIEALRFGQLTGKGYGQIKAVAYKEWSKGKHSIVPALEQKLCQKEQKIHPLLYSLITYERKKKSLEQEHTQALEVVSKKLENNEKIKSTWIAQLIEFAKNAGKEEMPFGTISNQIEKIEDEEKRDCIKLFMENCRDKNKDYIAAYLEGAKWLVRKGEN